VIRKLPLLVIVFAVVSTSSAAAHELDEWRDDWNGRIHDLTDGARGVGFSIVDYRALIELIQERDAVLDAHPGLFRRPETRRGHEHTYPDDVERWRDLVEHYFHPYDVDEGLRIIRCESGGDPDAKNSRSSASGLWQNLGKYWEGRSRAAGIPGADIFDPVASTIVAAWLTYETRGGFHHWTCY
jgi:hypothetical protein